jgi:hypothetical protein
MPLTAKGKKILAAMQEKYGEEEGTKVFYASANAGAIEGVHEASKVDPGLALKAVMKDRVTPQLPLPYPLPVDAPYASTPNNGLAGQQKNNKKPGQLNWAILGQMPGQTFPTIRGQGQPTDPPPVYTYPGGPLVQAAKTEIGSYVDPTGGSLWLTKIFKGDGHV